MIKTKKQSLILVGAFVLILMLFTTTYAFFNYTRTGSANTIRTGRISFNHTQGNSINLTNMFPIDVTNGIPEDNTKLGTLTINVTGDTTYTEGLEYLVSAVDVSNTVGSGANAKTLPISISVTVEDNDNNDPATSLGTSSNDYFNDRGGDTSYYSVVAGDVIENNDQLLVGYIKSGSTGVDGNIVIRAYLDASKIAITDTYPAQTVRTVKTTGYSSSDCETALTGVQDASTYCATASSLQDAIDGEDLTSAQITLLVNAGIVEEYTDGTTSEWVGDRTVFTTSEWNSLQTNGVSFQIKVESNEGTWVEEPVSNLIPHVICTYDGTLTSGASFTKGQFTYTYMQSWGAIDGWLEMEYYDKNTQDFVTLDGWSVILTDSIQNDGNSTDAVNGEICTIINDKPLVSTDAMFYNSNASSINLDGFNTSNIIFMREMFSGVKVSVLDISNFNVDNVLSPTMMFNNSTNLEKIYVSSDWHGFNINNNPNYYDNNDVFRNCSSIVGGNGTLYDSTKIGGNMAIIDGKNGQFGYLTDIAYKPNS